MKNGIPHKTMKKPVIWHSIKLMIFDCDGVLTDGRIVLTGELLESKNFSALDGMGFQLLHRSGMNSAVVTGRSSKSLERRCQELKIPYLLQGIQNKLEAVRELLGKLNLGFSNVTYMGDDWNDIPVMNLVAHSACPDNAMPEIKALADFISTRPGGFGAAREFIDKVLYAKGLYAKTVADYLKSIS
ncbi:MAG: HAD-IIIA family hydrolase [Candidatus Cloacimonetes bacterium]|nr:HAD-IIIA family hydrolase [Candidatus Cloacimonadota bacterium]